MKEFLSGNMAIKLIALTLAAILWFFVVDSEKRDSVITIPPALVK